MRRYTEVMISSPLRDLTPDGRLARSEEFHDLGKGTTILEQERMSTFIDSQLRLGNLGSDRHGVFQRSRDIESAGGHQGGTRDSRETIEDVMMTPRLEL